MSATIFKLVISNLYKIIEVKSSTISTDRLITLIQAIEVLTEAGRLPDVYVKKSNTLLHKLNNAN